MIQNPDTQVASCCRAIVHYILKEKLQVGDKLPPQDELRQQLNFSHNSVTPAMNLLAESGMIERKRRQGTIFVNPDALPAGLWRIALPFGILDASPGCQFGTMLSRYLQEKCQKALCHMRYYILDVDKTEKSPHAINHFSMLQNDLEAGRFDGILTPAFFSLDASKQAQELGTPLCNVGGWSATPIRVGIDVEDLYDKALKYLIDKKCKSIAIILDIQGHSTLINSIKQRPENIEIFEISPGAGTKEIVGQLKKQKPAGLIVLNDILALEIASHINDTSYKPELVIQSNKQLPLYYPLPVTKFEIDIETLADAGVTMLLNKIMNRDFTPIIQNIKARQID